MSDDNHTTFIEYREIAQAPGYRFGNDGSVYSCWRHCGRKANSGINVGQWKRLKATLLPTGYFKLSIRWNGKWTQFYLHSLILMVFRGPRPLGMQCRHLDDNKSNNCIDNLVWGTHHENVQDKIKNNHMPRGESHCCAKLTESQVREIRKLHTEGWRGAVLARRFNVGETAIYAIIKKAHWKHVV